LGHPVYNVGNSTATAGLEKDANALTTAWVRVFALQSPSACSDAADSNVVGRLTKLEQAVDAVMQACVLCCTRFQSSSYDLRQPQITNENLL